MLKKPITFRDFDDVEQTEVYWFHLSKSELIELETGAEGGSLGDQLKSIVAEQDVKKILKTFKTIILSAYGVRSEDGKRFVKSEESRKEFEQTPAYDALFTELVTSDTAAVEFVNGIVPKDLLAQAKAETVALPETSIEDVPWADREPTQKELLSMSQEQLRQVYARKTAGSNS